MKNIKPFHYECKNCGYIGKDGEFLDGNCPACCADIISGKVDKTFIPSIFWDKSQEGKKKKGGK